MSAHSHMYVHTVHTYSYICTACKYSNTYTVNIWGYTGIYCHVLCVASTLTIQYMVCIHRHGPVYRLSPTHVLDTSIYSDKLCFTAVGVDLTTIAIMFSLGGQKEPREAKDELAERCMPQLCYHTASNNLVEKITSSSSYCTTGVGPEGIRKGVADIYSASWLWQTMWLAARLLLLPCICHNPQINTNWPDNH